MSWETILSIAAIAIYFWLSNRKEPAPKDDSPPPSTGSGESYPNNAAAEERMRQIQEEIRRRLQQRQTGGSETPRPAPVAVRRAPPPEEGEFEAESPDPEETAEADTSTSLDPKPKREAPVVAGAAAPDLSALYAAQLARLEETRRGVVARGAMAAPESAGFSVRTEGSAGSITRAALLRDLHTPETLRRNILLREILDRPVALRRDGQ